jgi:nucleotide-binding universal stress UspA family protein
MFETIVIPLDGSETARAILTQIRKLLFHKDAELVLVRAVSIPGGMEGQTLELMEAMRARAAEELHTITRELTSKGARARSVVRTGDAADVILDVASEEGATLIAMSTHGRSGLGRWAFGSIAEKVLRASPIPVLALRSFTEAGRPTPAQDLTLKKILIPVSTDPLSLKVIEPALQLAKLFGSSVTILHACEGPACGLPVPELKEAYERFREAGLQVEPVMKQGDPAAQVLEACAELKADLIAMTTHGRTGIPRWMMGSVTEKVLRASKVPLLIVRPAKEAASSPRSRRSAQKSRK